MAAEYVKQFRFSNLTLIRLFFAHNYLRQDLRCDCGLTGKFGLLTSSPKLVAEVLEGEGDREIFRAAGGDDFLEFGIVAAEGEDLGALAGEGKGAGAADAGGAAGDEDTKAGDGGG